MVNHNAFVKKVCGKLHLQLSTARKFKQDFDVNMLILQYRLEFGVSAKFVLDFLELERITHQDFEIKDYGLIWKNKEAELLERYLLYCQITF